MTTKLVFTRYIVANEKTYSPGDECPEELRDAMVSSGCVKAELSREPEPEVQADADAQPAQEAKESEGKDEGAKKPKSGARRTKE